MDQNEDLLVTVRGHVGHLTLNRPKAINSLTHPMVTEMTAALTAWEHDDDVHAVVVSGAGDRGLCAGGDIVAIYHSAKAGGAEARLFWHDEYLLNAYIGRYPKPYVALMNGITMGGGVGISAHGDVRVVTEATKMAMPEVGIGFVPDVGGTRILAHAPGLLGLHAALTGAPFGGADAIAMGFADHYVPHADLASFVEAIESDGVERAVADFAQEPPAGELADHREWIDRCYAGESVAGIVDALRNEEDPAATKAADLISSRSPVALSVTLAAVRRARSLSSLEDVLQQEFRVSCAALRSHDLVEGIRAQVIDKDRNPQWNPATLDAVTDADVEAYFQRTDPDLTFQTETHQEQP